jgi:demethoxyubiquinone hydroxylase (CLK1/Coq7/Cat5 family)
MFVTRCLRESFLNPMSYLITFLVGAIAGLIGGLLIYRKHSAKFAQAEAKAREAAGVIRK